MWPTIAMVPDSRIGVCRPLREVAATLWFDARPVSGDLVFGSATEAMAMCAHCEGKQSLRVASNASERQCRIGDVLRGRWRIRMNVDAGRRARISGEPVFDSPSAPKGSGACRTQGSRQMVGSTSTSSSRKEQTAADPHWPLRPLLRRSARNLRRRARSADGFSLSQATEHRRNCPPSCPPSRKQRKSRSEETTSDQDFRTSG